MKRVISKKHRVAGRAAKKGAVKRRVKLPRRKLPDWVVARRCLKVAAFFERQRVGLGVALSELVPVLGISRQGWEKFARGSKSGPFLGTVFRAFHSLRLRGWELVISAEGARMQRSRAAG